MSCVFCGLTKENVVYEDEHVLVVVDLYPYSNRHLLIIPKQHKEFLHLCSDEELAAMMRAAKHLVKALNLTSYNLLQNNKNGQVIFHCHLHLIGANDSGCLKIGPQKEVQLDKQKYLHLVEEIKSEIQKSN